VKPQYLIPFKIQKKEARGLFKTWLGKGWYHPSGLGQTSILDKLQGVYSSFWTFSARIESVWKAEVGHEREERFYDSPTKEWKTRKKIVWRWENGLVRTTEENLLVVGNTLVSRTIFARLASFDFHDLAEFSPDYLAGWNAQGYDISLPEAWDVGKSNMRERAKDACYDDIDSNHVRNFSMKADFEDESWRYLLLPLYLASYRFEENTFQVMINGQTGVTAGQKPVAWWKIWLAIAAMLAPGFTLGLIGLPLLLVGGIGVVPLALGVILFVVGIVFAVILYRKAKESEEG
jgi:hypothetical protein